MKETQKKKDTICEHTCANCSCQNVRFFSAFFIFAVFETSMFFRDVSDRFPKVKKHNKYESNKNKKQQQRENQMQSKNKSKIMIQNKTTSRKTKTEEQLERKTNKQK